MIKAYTFSLILFLTCVLSAQKTSDLSVTFTPTIGDAPLVLNKIYDGSVEETLQIETLKCYISEVELFNEKEMVFAEENSFHLLDAEDAGSFTIHLSVPYNISFTQIKFNIGIDSLTNVSGVFGGDLDPTNGMYWTWQSGYINLKLEGVADKCPARYNRFQFHVGGYQYPFNTLQKVKLKTSNKKDIIIKMAIDEIFQQINLEKTYQIMSLNQEAVTFSQLIPTIFSIN